MAIPGCLAAVALLLALTACADNPPVAPVTPPPPQTAVAVVCPPDPPSGFVCAPPLVCRDAPAILAWDNKWIVSVFTTTEQRQGVAMITLGLEKLFCGGAPSPAGTAVRKRLQTDAGNRA